MSATASAMTLASKLPPRLQSFFQKYPPPSLMPHLYTNTTEFGPPPARTSATDASARAQDAAPSDVNVPAQNATATDANAPAQDAVSTSASAKKYYSPFLPHKNHLTGHWQGPRFSLRRQAELVKIADKHGVLDLLPWSRKLPSEREKRREEQGLRVKGTGVGQKVKGKEWERKLKGKLETRRQAMLKMPEMVQEWKQRGHGRGWKKWPK